MVLYVRSGKMNEVKNSHFPLCTISMALNTTCAVYARLTMVTSSSAMVLTLVYPKTLL